MTIYMNYSLHFPSIQSTTIKPNKFTVIFSTFICPIFETFPQSKWKILVRDGYLLLTLH